MENDDVNFGMGLSPHDEVSTAVFRGEVGEDLDEVTWERRNTRIALDTANSDLNYARIAISEMSDAIILLKKYILENGLDPFWEKIDVKVPLKNGFTTAEILEKNNDMSGRIQRRATNPDAIKQPTPEELEKLYSDRLKQQDGSIP